MTIKRLENQTHDMAELIDGNKVAWFEIELGKKEMHHLHNFLNQSHLTNTKYLGGYMLKTGHHGAIYSDAIICEVDTGVEVNLDDLAYDFCALVEDQDSEFGIDYVRKVQGQEVK